MPARRPTLLTPEQRLFFSQIPDDLPDRDITRHYTLSAEDLAVVARQHGARNRLGFAVQLCVLRYPGRPLTDLLDIPLAVLTYIAGQVGVAPEAFSAYGERESTVYEHLNRIRRLFGFRDYGLERRVSASGPPRAAPGGDGGPTRHTGPHHAAQLGAHQSAGTL